MKILAWKNEDGDVLGRDIQSWRPNSFNDWTDEDNFIAVAPFLIVEDDYFIYPYYEDISSIESWNRWGMQYKKQWDGTRLTWSEVWKEIKKLKEEKESNNIPLTAKEMAVIDKMNLNSYFKLYDLVEDFTDPTILPADYDYNILGLKKKRYFTRGDLTKVELYKNYNPATQEYSDLYVEEERVITRVGGFAAYRTQTTKWYMNDDTIGGETVDIKGYSLQEAIQEGVQRRDNIISQLKIDVIGIIAVVEQIPSLSAEEPAKEILRQITDELSLYSDGDPMPLINKFKKIRSSRLDYYVPGTGNTLTLRDYILNSIIF